jgi:chromate reductase
LYYQGKMKSLNRQTLPTRTDPMRVLGISGSVRSGSHNTAIVRHAGDLFTAAGARFNLYEDLISLPPFRIDGAVEAASASVAQLREAVAGADAALIATPEYNWSIPGALKNAIDWLARLGGSHVLQAKPVAVIGTTTGLFGALQAQADLRRVLTAAGARVVNRPVAIGHMHTRFDSAGRIDDPHLERGIRAAVQALLAGPHYATFSRHSIHA